LHEYYTVTPHSDELYHWGVKGMKWGVRRYQNKDGSLTDAGKKRAESYRQKELSRLDKTYDTSRLDKRIHKTAQKISDRMPDSTPDDKRYNKLVDKAKRDSFTYYYKQGMKAVETSRLNNMTLKQIDTERKNIGAVKAANVLSIVGGSTMAAIGGFGYIRTVDTTSYKTNSRVTDNDRARVVSDARVESSGDVESMLETGFNNIGRKNPRKWERPT